VEQSLCNLAISRHDDGGYNTVLGCRSTVLISVESGELTSSLAKDTAMMNNCLMKAVDQSDRYVSSIVRSECINMVIS
jgi:hypothetical protein